MKLSSKEMQEHNTHLRSQWQRLTAALEQANSWVNEARKDALDRFGSISTSPDPEPLNPRNLSPRPCFPHAWANEAREAAPASLHPSTQITYLTVFGCKIWCLVSGVWCLLFGG